MDKCGKWGYSSLRGRGNKKGRELYASLLTETEQVDDESPLSAVPPCGRGYFFSVSRLASQSRDCGWPFRSDSILPLMVSAVTLPLYF